MFGNHLKKKNGIRWVYFGCVPHRLTKLKAIWIAGKEFWMNRFEGLLA